jgi:hypothetical protein
MPELRAAMRVEVTGIVRHRVRAIPEDPVRRAATNAVAVIRDRSSTCGSRLCSRGLRAAMEAIVVRQTTGRPVVNQVMAEGRVACRAMVAAAVATVAAALTVLRVLVVTPQEATLLAVTLLGAEEVTLPEDTIARSKQIDAVEVKVRGEKGRANRHALSIASELTYQFFISGRSPAHPGKARL